MEIIPEIAELLGAFVGDGWIDSRERGLYILGDPTEDKLHYDKILAPYFSKYFSPVKPSLFSKWGVYGIACYKRKAIKHALKLGFISGSKAKIAKIPEEIFDSPAKIRCAFLRGLFDTDGSFYCDRARGKFANSWRKKHHHQPRIEFHLSSKKLVYGLQRLCNLLGIKGAKIIENKGKRSNNRNNSNSYKFRINKKEHIDVWFNKIGSNNPRQKTKYLIWQKYRFLPPKTSLKDRFAILENKLNPFELY